MIIREIQPNDDRHKIAELIYGTDPYIYPFWLDGVSDKLGAIGSLIDMPGSVFHCDNLLVAEENGQIIGVFGYLHAGGDFSYDYRWEHELQPNFPYVYAKYFDPTIKQAKSSPEDTAVVLNFCIAAEHRGKGYGKQMFTQAAEILRDRGFKHLVFDCLADNDAALQTYKSAGCEIVKNGFGFNGFDPNKPPEVVYLECRL